MEHYVVICEYSCDGEAGVDIITVQHEYDKALEIYKEQLSQEKKNADNNGYSAIEEEENFFVAWKDGEYCLDHIQLYIERVV